MANNIQEVFSSVNPSAPTHALAPGECATATNIDFALGNGAAVVRRGCAQFAAPDSPNQIRTIFRNYNSANNLAADSFYIADQLGNVFVGSGSAWSLLYAGGATAIVPMNNFQQYTYITGMGTQLKNDGTHTTDWVMQSPPAPRITVSTLAPLDLTKSGTNTYNVTVGGSVGLSAGTLTFTNDPATLNAQVLMTFSGPPFNLDTNSGHTIGNFGVYFVDIAFSDPTQVGTVMQLYSIGDASFSNYFIGTISPNNAVTRVAATPNPNTLIDAQLAVGTSSTTALTPDTRAFLISEIAVSTAPVLSGLSQLSNVLSPWGVGRTEFAMVGNYSGTNPWQQIYAVQYVFQMAGTCTMTLAAPSIWGSQDYPLNSPINGYTYWQTFATLDTSSFKISEGAPGPPTGPIYCQMAQSTATLAGLPTGTIGGVNAVITYRQGGLMQTPYAVATQSFAMSTLTLTDTVNDIQAISLNWPLTINLLAASGFPADITAIAEPFQQRLFATHDNTLMWSLPNIPSSFPSTSYTQVSSVGDNIKALVVWPPGIIIINQNSVYEMVGQNFESNPDWVLQRTAARKGTIAPRVAIKTPYGIPLLSYDGLTMYVPGQGVDVLIDWLHDKYAAMFRGAGAADPAARGGSRIPALNYSFIIDASAAFMEDRLYLAAATGTDTTPQTVYVLDFVKRQCFWYHYPFSIYSMYFDYQNARLLAGTSDGSIMQLETGEFDVNSTGTSTAINWTIKTRAFSVANDTVAENISLDCAGTVITASAIYDNGSATLIGTLTNTQRAWATPPLGGTFSNNVQFEFDGTYTAGTNNAIYQMNFDMMPEPVKVRYFKTPYDERGYEGDKLWDVAYYDIENRAGTGTISAVTFVDNTAVMTQTFQAPLGGRVVVEKGFPAETYGRVAFTTFTSTDLNTLVKIWRSYYDSRQEPAKVTYWRTDIESLDEQICDEFDVDINPNGTVTGTPYVNGTAVTAAITTFTGTLRQSYVATLPEELYGRTLWVVYTGAQPFKHYRTWYHLRAEPNRVSQYVTSKVSVSEHEWKFFHPEINCLGNTVFATAFIEDTPIAVYTLTGSARERFSLSLPPYQFGRTVWSAYAGFTDPSATTPAPFKHYYPSGLSVATRDIEFEGDPEPDRGTSYRTGPYPFPASNYLKTWLPLLDPLNGTVTGTLTVDDNLLAVTTFTGDRRQWFTYALDLSISNAVQTGSRWEALYTSATPFKHYQTKLESETKPFGKNTWVYSYRKLGGASQLDLARFWSLEAESTNTEVLEYFWDIDGVNMVFSTLTLTGGVQWIDRIAMPPGCRGYIFLFRSRSLDNGNYKIYKVNLDLDQEGIKGLVRREVPGTPDNRGQNE